MSYRKKLIEVALPLDAINLAAAHEKSVPRKGHPATLHLWWARRPLAACRAVLFASLVDDPSSHPDRFPDEEAQSRERARLFDILSELVTWENSTNPTILARARDEIVRSCDGNLPLIVDPFCGGGSIPLEAQRLGLRAQGSDLNPVAVLVSRSLLQLSKPFEGNAPIHASGGGSRDLGAWSGAHGLAEDVRHYGEWMRDEAFRRIGDHYPDIHLSTEKGGRRAAGIAWLWTRTVRCPNPACGIDMPLVRSWVLSSKKGREAWVEAVADRRTRTVTFQVRKGRGAPKFGSVSRTGATCIGCNTTSGLDYVRGEGKGKRMGVRLLACIGAGQRSRLYISPHPRDEAAANTASPQNAPDTDLPDVALGFRIQGYGLTKHRDLFSSRQLLCMVTFSDLVMEARAKIVADALSSPSFAGAIPGKDAQESVNTYADALCTYLAFAVSKLADWNSAVCSWIPAIEGIRDTFARSALPMVWDFAEINPFSNSVGSFGNHVEWVASAVAALVPGTPPGSVLQRDAAVSAVNGRAMISTDPPYYDNIGYADLSDFFYVWLRRSLASIYPSEMSTLLVPKSQELIAASYRFNGDRHRADAHFEEGLSNAFRWMHDCQDERFPLTIYYAFKQAEDDDELGRASTGWETMLQGLLDSGFRIEGTWPMRTERSGRMRDNKSNALASSIILVCRPRTVDATITTRKDFVSELRASLPQAMRALQTANIAPVDLAQSAIGPGMAVFSRFTRVIDAEGNAMSVRAALGLINQVLDELVTEEEGELDPDTRWALAWFEQFGFGPGSFGIAETLSKAKNTSIAKLVDAGIVLAPAGTVRLIAADDLDPNWNPASADRLTLWEVAHHLSRALEVGGENAAALLLRRVGGLGVDARSLAYRLYMLCERKKWAKEALAYNALVVAWPDLVSQAADGALPSVVQQTIEV